MQHGTPPIVSLSIETGVEQLKLCIATIIIRYTVFKTRMLEMRLNY